MFIVVQDGLEVGDEVVLNPLSHVEEAQTEAAMTLEMNEPLGALDSPAHSEALRKDETEPD
jgi:hypothetical protein